MDNLPLVSILIPVFNRERFIGSCIESALSQTYANIEIIIVDNCSSDNTWKICTDFAQSDDRIKIYRNENNIGPVKNWKKAVDYANGLFGKILFSDDLMKPEFIEETLKLFNEKVAFVYSTANIGEIPWEGCDNYSIPGITYLTKRAYVKMIAKFSGPVSPGCALFRISSLKQNILETLDGSCFDDFSQHGAGPDVLTFLLSLDSYSRVGIINKPLVFFRAHPNSFTIADKEQKLYKRYLNAICWYAENKRCNVSSSYILTEAWTREKDKRDISYEDFSKEILGKTIPKKNEYKIINNTINKIKYLIPAFIKNKLKQIGK